MKLLSFRIQNYKKIKDTDWVSCKDLTVFVGKNESGKSAIFRGLSKLNASDGQNYDGLKEFPRRRYTDEFTKQDWPVSSAKFLLNNSEKTELQKIFQPLSEVDFVTVTRHYSGKYDVTFDLRQKFDPVLNSETKIILEQIIEKIKILTAPAGKGEALGTIKQQIIPHLEAQINGVNNQNITTKVQIESILTNINSFLNEEWAKELFSNFVNSLNALHERIDNNLKLGLAEIWITSHLPSFVYFDRYDVIDSSIHLPTFSTQISQTPFAAKVRATQCLFKQVGLDISTISSLGRHTPGQAINGDIQRKIDERMIHASSASNAMTAKFSDWWDQRKHKFHYKFDGDYFRIWVSDDLDPSEIELDQRSGGMQYFFSFFVVFLVESAEKHANSILLLDEPGLQLHGTAQAKIIDFLEKLSKDNQVLYTTHSPFMINANHLERARAVFEDMDGTTKVSEDVWPRDKDSLFPLQAALGYKLAQSLFISKRQLIVEGTTDQWILHSIIPILEKTGRRTIRSDVVIVPSAGLSHLFPLASMLIGHDIEVAALLDGDEPARRDGKKLVNKLLNGIDRKCLFIGDFSENNNAEIEDLFPEDKYLECVAEAYPSLKIEFNNEEKKINGIIDKLKANFKRNNFGRFEKWKVVYKLNEKILADPAYLPKPTLDLFEKIIDSINSLFSK